MRSKKILAILLSLVLALSMSPGFALAAPQANLSLGGEAPNGDAAQDAHPQQLAAGEVEPSAADADSLPAWEARDFTYGPYKHTLYGCDYSRQFDVEGLGITGFSKEGLAKLKAGKTDLVIPRSDGQGTPIVAVCDNAFENMGLTSVEFPTGMLVDYDDPKPDPAIPSVSRRGNFVIGGAAFAKNKLTEVSLPAGVIAVMPNAFHRNQIKTVTLPRTIWWVETLAFASNRIETINFPTTTDFMLEMHGMAFFDNLIKSVRLPDLTEVVNKDTFSFNPGAEPLDADTPDRLKNPPTDARVTNKGKQSGVVHMYYENVDLATKGRIHHLGHTTENTKSWWQKLVPGSITSGWQTADFTFDGQKVTGLTKSGIAKRASHPDLVIPDRTPNGYPVTEIASSDNIDGGLFGTKEQGFNSVSLPTSLKKIGDRAFASTGLTLVEFGNQIEEIGMAAFQNNQLTSVVLPDSVTKLGGGAFATNATLQYISLSKGLTEVADGAFGCSDSKNYMTGLTSIDIPEGITRIGANAFAGNNFTSIKVPCSVKEIGRFAFSTKNYLMTPATLSLPEGLTSIGTYAFRNKVISEVELPTTVLSLPENAFAKEYSDGTEPVITKVYVATQAQADDDASFPDSKWHNVLFKEREVTPGVCKDESEEPQPADVKWLPEDFTYNGATITGWSETGQAKRKLNHDVVLPDNAPDGTPITAIGPAAFMSPEDEVHFDSAKYDYTCDYGIESIVLPKGLVSIGKDAFQYNNLKAVPFDTTPKLTTIGETAFKGNKLTTCHIPDTVTNLGDGAFAVNTIVDLKLSRGVTRIPDGCFSNNIRLAQVEIPDTVTEIGEMAFAGARITSLAIPASVKKIERKAFHLHRMAELTVPGTVKEIGESAFEGTFKAQTLKKLVLGEGIETIGRRAFKEGLLTDVALPASLKSLGEEPFENNTGKSGLRTGQQHVVLLTTDNPAHLKWNDGAKTHLIKLNAQTNIWVRLAGGNAYGTMADIAKEGWKTSADTVIVATIDGYWDALAASSLAGKTGAPILLTNKDALEQTTADEMARLKPKNAIIVGGRGSVSDAVKAEIEGKGIAVSRVAGGNAPQTAIEIAKQVAGESDTCIIATSKGFHDALSVSPYAFAKKAPIYLTDDYGELSDETMAAIEKGGFKHVVIAGGRGSVSPRTEGELKEAGIADVQRKAGANAVDTSVDFAAFAIKQGMSANFMGVATTDSFYDALTGGPLCGINNGVMVLANNENTTATTVPSVHKTDIGRAYIFGGRGSLSAEVFETFDATTK